MNLGTLAKQLLVVGLGVLSVLVGLLFYRAPDIRAPDHAKVWIHDETRVYTSPPCFDALLPKLKEGHSYREGTLEEARKLGYAPDKKCQERSGFVQKNRMAVEFLLARFGLLEPLPSRWMPDGNWNW
ncbi:MAG TPA: hypothetical protein PLM79_13845 [Syntrophobacteraceae bacterium]|nr:hypothetical protein [Syntrophobacteraceae bacterium]